MITRAVPLTATGEELVSKSLLERRFMLALLGGFALLAGLLAAVDLWAWSASSRRNGR
jgi:hypothetical protein